MIEWEDRSNSQAPHWWALTIWHVVRVDVSCDGLADPWRVAIGWAAGNRDRFDLPAHWTDTEAMAEALRFVAPRLAAFASEVAAAAREVSEAVDAAAASR